MITEYHRPKTLEEALALLTHPTARPLGGGTLLSHATPDPVQVIDLQELSLDSLTKTGNNLDLGATLTLQALLESEHCPEPLKQALKLEAQLNLRNAATVAGTLVTCDGRSTFASVMLAMDTKLEQATLGEANIDYELTNIGDFLPLRSSKLITKIYLPLNVKLAFEYVARTPADKPIVCVAIAQWNSGRTRMAVGGFGKSPLLAMDGDPHPYPSPDGSGNESEGFEAAARNACHEANDDFGSAEYRMDVAATLAKRCMEQINA